MNSNEENSSIENEYKLEKNISDLKTNLKDIDLTEIEYIKVYKNKTKNFDSLSANKQVFFKKIFHRFKIFLLKKEVFNKTKKIMFTIFKKIK
jgi:hypothetical protein